MYCIHYKIINFCVTGNNIRSQLVFLESNFTSASQEINSLQILRDQDQNKVLMNIKFKLLLVCILIKIY